MSMQWDGTVKIAITSHEVVHIIVLFLEVLQIVNGKTQAIGLINLIPGRSQVTQECGRYLACVVKEDGDVGREVGRESKYDLDLKMKTLIDMYSDCYLKS